MAPPAALTSAALKRRVEALLEARGALDPRGPAQTSPPSQPHAPARKQPRAPSSPASFVCEADVRQALLDRRKISISGRTIVTPSARELGDTHQVFVEI